MPRPLPLPLQEAEQQQLREWVSAFGTPQQVALRSRIVLAAAEGQSDNAIAQSLDLNRKTVMLWRGRFAEEGLDSLWETETVCVDRDREIDHRKAIALSTNFGKDSAGLHVTTPAKCKSLNCPLI